jgi:hypothetical protein
VTEALEVCPRGRTGANSDENPGPSGLISRLKVEVALSADGRRTGWPRWAWHRLCLARVRWFAIPAAQDAALPERGCAGGRRARRSRVGQGQGGQALGPAGTAMDIIDH